MPVIWFFLLILSLFLPLILMTVIWYFWSKDKLRVEKIRNKEIQIKKRLNRYIWKEEAPFGELRIPLMMLTVSSMVFVIITTGFGESINVRTGQPIWKTDWDQYWDKETGLHDSWVVTPMDRWTQHNPELVLLMIYGGYCGVLSVLILGWFEYMKWRWEHIPVEIKYRTILKIEKDYIKRNGPKN